MIDVTHVISHKRPSAQNNKSWEWPRDEATVFVHLYMCAILNKNGLWILTRFCLALAMFSSNVGRTLGIAAAVPFTFTLEISTATDFGDLECKALARVVAELSRGGDLMAVTDGLVEIPGVGTVVGDANDLLPSGVASLEIAVDFTACGDAITVVAGAGLTSTFCFGFCF